MGKNIKELGEALVNLTATEVKELALYLKETYGIEQQSTAYLAPGYEGENYKPTTEKLLYDIVLKDIGAQKLMIVKLVKDFTGLGLKEAKELVDRAPTVIKEGLPKNEAENIKNQLINAGAAVDLR